MHKTWVEIDERALTSNITALRSLLNPGARFCAVLKANAYGHGLVEVARIAGRAGVDAFAVAGVEEALVLRGMFPSALIVVLGYTLRDRYEEALTANIHLTVYDKDSVLALETVAARRACTAFAHLKIESGMGRQGVLPEQLYEMLEVIGQSAHVSLAGLSTHFANADEAGDSRFATQQFTVFQQCVTAVQEAGFHPEWVHAANSAATILYPDTHGTLARVGAAMYGFWPSEATERVSRRHNLPLELQPVLTWKTRVAQVKSLAAGTPVGYGLTETLRKNSRVAVLPVGYWDGYDRGISSVADVLINGTRCKVVGRISMNMTVVDVSAVAQVEPEQEVILIGRSGRFVVSADELAVRAETIPYEILTRINPLLPRVVV